MSEIIIKTGGTIDSTILTVDGVDKTSEECVVSINMYARAPIKGSVSGDTYPGYVDVSYACMDSGVLKRTSIETCSTPYGEGVGCGEMEDKINKLSSSDQVIQFVGRKVDQEKEVLVDKIISYCNTNNIPCPIKDELVIRTKESLQDKITDLELKG
jgi:hypothetical protein